jgi:hypothetical protein
MLYTTVSFLMGGEKIVDFYSLFFEEVELINMFHFYIYTET